MPYFKNDNVNVLFIHIPKTGGSSIENYFSSKFDINLDNKTLYLFNEELTDIKSYLQHITYSEMVKYNKIFNIDFNAKIITVVRNPYQRIISDLFFLSKIDINTSREKVFDVITNYLESTDCDNHNLPQHVFIMDNNRIIPNIHILKTESLTDNMHLLGYDDFDRFDNKNSNSINYMDYLNNESIELCDKWKLSYDNDKIKNYSIMIL